MSERRAPGVLEASGVGRHHRPGGGFRNPALAGAPTRFCSFLRWVLVERVRRPPPPDPDPSVFARVPPSFPRPRAAPEQIVVTWVGHATALLQIGGLNLLTDPMWSERASPLSFTGPRRRVPPAVPLESLPPVDAVLLSHDHYDHLDEATTRWLAARHPQAQWLVPLGLGSLVRRAGAASVHELDWWEEAHVGAAAVACTPAQHFSGRGVSDRNRTLWCGWAVAVGARRAFFAGDSGYGPDFARIGRRYGPFDVALLPIGAYEPRWFMSPVHMNPEEAVQAFTDLCGNGLSRHRAVMVPIHWGTFKLTDEPMDEPPARVRRAWSAAGLPGEDLWLLAHGESRGL